MSYRILEGDCIAAMRDMDEASVDSIVTDPPYGLEFMGKEWDRLQVVTGGAGFSKPGIGDRQTPWMSPTGSPNPSCRNCGGSQRGNDRKGGFTRCRCENPDFPDHRRAQQHAMQEWHQAWATEALRVLKPGGYAVVAGGTRTFHRLVCALEDAGFEIRDTIAHMYGSGFPKSLNVSEALRKLPACPCDVPSHPGAVDSGLPTSAVGAGIGAEAGTMPLAGSAADSAEGIGPNVGANSAGSLADVESGVEDVVGNGSPVVLGSSGVAGATEGDEVVGDVGGVDVAPEADGDQMVGDESFGDAAVGTSSVPGDDLGGDGGPAASSVLPLSSSPSGVASAPEPAAVGDAHAGVGAVDGDALAVADGDLSTLGASELHGLKCKTCGGVRRDLIPEGFGTALKPSFEPWTLARKPLAGTVAQNVLEHGTGALNIDGCRLEGAPPSVPQPEFDSPTGQIYGMKAGEGRNGEMSQAAGRWPANAVLSHLPECERVGVRKVKGHAGYPNGPRGNHNRGVIYGAAESSTDPRVGHADPDGTETIPEYRCVEGCPVAELDRQSGERRSAGEYQKGARGGANDFQGPASINIDGLSAAQYGDTGGASRFFYTAKSSRAERQAGVGANAHPT